MSVDAQPVSDVAPASREGGSGRRPKVIAVLAPKGGVGKTTLSMGLLVSARQAGVAAVGVGMDPQRTLEVWGRTREKQRASEAGGSVVEVPITTVLIEDWHRLSALGGVDLAVLDTPPGHVQDITAIIGVARLADVVVIPTSASEIDLFHVKAFYRRLGHPKSFFVLNRTKRRTRSFASARDGLMRSGRLCPVDIPDRDAICGEFARGLVLADTGLPGSEFFDGMWNFLAGELGFPVIGMEAMGDDHAA